MGSSKSVPMIDWIWNSLGQPGGAAERCDGQMAVHHVKCSRRGGSEVRAEGDGRRAAARGGRDVIEGHGVGGVVEDVTWVVGVGVCPGVGGCVDVGQEWGRSASLALIKGAVRDCVAGVGGVSVQVSEGVVEVIDDGAFADLGDAVEHRVDVIVHDVLCRRDARGAGSGDVGGAQNRKQEQQNNHNNENRRATPSRLGSQSKTGATNCRCQGRGGAAEAFENPRGRG